MKTLQELRSLILEWARDKDLLHAENAPKQRLKLLEEVGETAKAILKKDVPEQKDGIGHLFVVLVILDKQTNSDFNIDFENIYTMHFENEYNILADIAFTYDYISCEFAYLNELANRLGHALTECANLAWNEIKDKR